MINSRRATVLAFLLAACAGTPPLAADWLVLREGGAIETEGAWEVEGKVVVFHRRGGELASVRLQDVDIERSDERTAAARKPKPEPPPAAEPPAPVEPVLVLTDADVGHVAPRRLQAADDSQATAEGGAGEPTEEIAGPDRAPAAGAVDVADWRAISDMEFPGTRIGGTIRNTSEHVAINIVLTARLTDEDGRVVGTGTGRLARSGLAPGASTTFEVDFSGIYSYVGIDFDVQSFDAVRGRGEE